MSAATKTSAPEGPAKQRGQKKAPAAPYARGARHAQPGPARPVRAPRCACGGGCPRCRHAPRVQYKLAVGRHDGPDEAEAERVSALVLSLPDSLFRADESATSRDERESEVEVSGHTQPHFAPAASGATGAEKVVPVIEAAGDEGPSEESVPEVEEHLATVRGRGQPLPASARAFFEPRFGYDFGDVRIHADPQAADAARSAGALAYTVGNDIIFAAGQYAPETAEGRRLLAHELTHVVQQGGAGAARPAVSRRRAAPRLQRRSIKESVEEFKMKIDSKKMLEQGQFFWGEFLTDEILKRTEELLGELFRGKDSGLGRIIKPGQLRRLFKELYEESLGHNPYENRSREIRANILKLLEQGKNVKLMSELRALVGSGLHATFEGGRDTFTLLYLTFIQQKQAPDYRKFLSYDRFAGLLKFQSMACFMMADFTITAFYARGGFAAGKRQPFNKLALTFPCEKVQRHEMPSQGKGKAKGDVVIYKSTLPETVNRLKRALDDGFLIHAGVLSGEDNGMAMPTCHDDHTLAILGYSGDKFVFWDAANASVSGEFGEAFGFLFYDSANNRLTTAKDDDDLAVTRGGQHINAQHRYQVVKLLS